MIDGLSHLRKIVTRWDEEWEDKATPLPEMANVIHHLDLLTGDLKMFRSRLEQEFATRAETKLVEFDGGTAEIRGGTKRTQWDNDLLYSRVVARALDERKVNEETGEYEAADQAVARVLKDCARPSWRVTALRAIGLKPDDFCTTEWGQPSVLIRVNEEEK